jgi:hypothetical protein
VAGLSRGLEPGHFRPDARRACVPAGQDTILTEEPKDRGPIEDVAASTDYLGTVIPPRSALEQAAGLRQIVGRQDEGRYGA